MAAQTETRLFGLKIGEKALEQGANITFGGISWPLTSKTSVIEYGNHTLVTTYRGTEQESTHLSEQEEKIVSSFRGLHKIRIKRF